MRHQENYRKVAQGNEGLFRKFLMIASLAIMIVLGYDLYTKYQNGELFTHDYTVELTATYRTTDNIDYSFPVVLSYKSSEKLEDNILSLISNRIAKDRESYIGLNDLVSKSSEDIDAMFIFNLLELDSTMTVTYEYYDRMNMKSKQTRITHITLLVPEKELNAEKIQLSFARRKAELEQISALLKVETAMIRAKSLIRTSSSSRSSGKNFVRRTKPSKKGFNN